jgi:integrase
VDFDGGELAVRRGKGQKDRRTMLPAKASALLRDHIKLMHKQHGIDVREGAGFVELPQGLARKNPGASQEWMWQWVFPATRMHRDRETGEHRRHHPLGDRRVIGLAQRRSDR